MVLVKEMVGFRLDPQMIEIVEGLKISDEDTKSDVLRRILVYITRNDSALQSFIQFQKSGLDIPGSTTALSDKLRAVSTDFGESFLAETGSDFAPNMQRMAMLLEYIYLVNRVQLRDNYSVFEDKIESQTLVLLEENHAKK